MRVLYEQPETMGPRRTDEPPRQGAKGWLFDELEQFRGTVLVI